MWWLGDFKRGLRGVTTFMVRSGISGLEASSWTKVLSMSMPARGRSGSGKPRGFRKVLYWHYLIGFTRLSPWMADSNTPWQVAGERGQIMIKDTLSVTANTYWQRRCSMDGPGWVTGLGMSDVQLKTLNVVCFWEVWISLWKWHFLEFEIGHPDQLPGLGGNLWCECALQSYRSDLLYGKIIGRSNHSRIPQ